MEQPDIRAAIIDDEAHIALYRLRTHLRTLRTDLVLPITDLEQNIERTLGLAPLFPGQYLCITNYATNEVVHAKDSKRSLGIATRT